MPLTLSLCKEEKKGIIIKKLLFIVENTHIVNVEIRVFSAPSEWLHTLTL